MIDEQELINDIKDIISDKKEEGQANILTTDIIRKHQGNYYNANVSARKSWNAAFGRFLKKNQRLIGISELASDENTTDDNGNSTSCSRWKIL